MQLSPAHHPPPSQDTAAPINQKLLSTKTPQTQQPFTKRRYTKEDITKSRLKKNSTQQRKHLKIIENLAEQSPYFPHKICSTVCLPFPAK